MPMLCFITLGIHCYFDRIPQTLDCASSLLNFLEVFFFIFKTFIHLNLIICVKRRAPF